MRTYECMHSYVLCVVVGVVLTPESPLPCLRSMDRCCLCLRLRLRVMCMYAIIIQYTVIKLVLDEVKDTYHDVRRLEASIIELHKMFMDLALLVDRQGEMLDQIEYQVNRKMC